MPWKTPFLLTEGVMEVVSPAVLSASALALPPDSPEPWMPMALPQPIITKSAMPMNSARQAAMDTPGDIAGTGWYTYYIDMNNIPENFVKICEHASTSQCLCRCKLIWKLSPRSISFVAIPMNEHWPWFQGLTHRHLCEPSSWVWPCLAAGKIVGDFDEIPTVRANTSCGSSKDTWHFHQLAQLVQTVKPAEFDESKKSIEALWKHATRWYRRPHSWSLVASNDRPHLLDSEGGRLLPWREARLCGSNRWNKADFPASVFKTFIYFLVAGVVTHFWAWSTTKSVTKMMTFNIIFLCLWPNCHPPSRKQSFLSETQRTPNQPTKAQRVMPNQARRQSPPTAPASWLPPVRLDPVFMSCASSK